MSKKTANKATSQFVEVPLVWSKPQIHTDETNREPVDVEYVLGDLPDAYPAIEINAEGTRLTFFLAEGKEVLRIEDNGNIFVHEKKIANDIEIVEGLREFLKDTLGK